MEHRHHHGHDHHGHHHGEDTSTGLAELLDLDGEVMSSYLTEVISWAADRTRVEPHRILDLGAGTGNGIVALGRRFAEAELVAADRTPDMLARTEHKARALGLLDRLRTVAVDLDASWPDVGPVDLVWAASSLHELADPDRVFTAAYAALRPGGLFVATEMDAPPRFLPDDPGLGVPGLEERCRTITERETPQHPDWGPHLVRAGFTDLVTRTFVIDQPAPSSPATGRYAHAYLSWIRPHVADSLGAADLAALDQLLDPQGPAGLRHRTDLVVRGSRTGWVARRA